jgi:NAD+ diphosphatase
MVLKTFFSGGVIDRSGHIRESNSLLQQAWAAATSRVVVISESRCLVENEAAILLTTEALGNSAGPDTGVYLGRLDGAHIFAHVLPEATEHETPGSDRINREAFANFRGLLSNLAEQDAALLAYAKGMIEWQERHRYCGVCGARNNSQAGGFVMACSSEECGHRSFPRIDPAVIALVVDQNDNNRCLLGRQHSWPEGRYSTVAGFVEPGESLEDAVTREVQEETNVHASAVRYLGSQPWPFPTGMMIGFQAQAAGDQVINLNDGELADARWFSRQDLVRGDAVLPPATSIAFRLIEHWFDQWDGPRLGSLNLSGDFSRRTGERT